MNSSKKLNQLFFIQNGLLYLGYSSFFALISIYFVEVLGYSMSLTASMLLFCSISMRLVRILFAPLLDWISVNQGLPLSMLICSVGFLLLGFAQKPLIVAFIIFFISIGYGGTILYIKYAIAEINKTNRDMSQGFVYLGIFNNIGASMGPICAGYLLSFSSAFIYCFFSAIVFAVGFLFALLIGRRCCIKVPKQKWLASYQQNFVKPVFRNIFIISCLWWFLYGQIFSTLPLFVNQALNATYLLGIIYLVNTLLVIIFSVKLFEWVRSWLSNNDQMIIFAFSSFFIGFIALLIFPSAVMVFVAIVFFTITEIILVPLLNTLIASSSKQTERMPIFAINSLAMGIGEGIGAYFGVWIINIGLTLNNWHLSLLILSAVTLLVILLSIFVLRIQTKGG